MQPVVRNFDTVEAAKIHYDEVYAGRNVRVTLTDGSQTTGLVLSESVDGGVGEHGEVYSLSVLVQLDRRPEAVWRYVDEVVLLPTIDAQRMTRENRYDPHLQDHYDE